MDVSRKAAAGAPLKVPRWWRDVLLTLASAQ
jgi:hypothetical protein